MLDLGYGDALEREFAEKCDDDSEHAHAALHGPDSPYSLPERAGRTRVLSRLASTSSRAPARSTKALGAAGVREPNTTTRRAAA